MPRRRLATGPVKRTSGSHLVTGSKCCTHVSVTATYHASFVAFGTVARGLSGSSVIRGTTRTIALLPSPPAGRRDPVMVSGGAGAVGRAVRQVAAHGKDNA